MKNKKQEFIKIVNWNINDQKNQGTLIESLII